MNLKFPQPSRLQINRQLNQFAGAAGWWEERVRSTNNGVFPTHVLPPAGTAVSTGNLQQRMNERQIQL